MDSSSSHKYLPLFYKHFFPQIASTSEKPSEVFLMELSLWFSHLGLRNYVMLDRRILWLNGNRAFCVRGSYTYTSALWDHQERNCVWTKLMQTSLPASLYWDGTMWPSATVAMRIWRQFRGEQEFKWCLYGWTEGTINLGVCNITPNLGNSRTTAQ